MAGSASGRFDAVAGSTDSEEYGAIARRYGADRLTALRGATARNGSLAPLRG